MWEKIIAAVPDFFKGLFGIIDKSITDKDAANQMKLDILTTIAGKGSSSWLASNAFPLAMLLNFAMVMVLATLGRPVPDWSLVVALLWLAGPLLNTLSKDTISKIIDLVRNYRKEQEGQQLKEGDPR